MKLRPRTFTCLALAGYLCAPQQADARGVFGPPSPPGTAATPATAPQPVPAPVSAPATEPGPAVAPVDDGEHESTVSLVDVFALLKKKSPRYKVYEADVEVAKADVVAARVLPNPVLQLAMLYLNVGFNQNGVATYYANATLPLLVAGQRRMRVKTANAGVRSAEAGRELNYHELAHEARSVFVEMQADQARLSTYDSAVADLARLQALIAARRSSGVETDYDILRIDVEAAAWKARRVEEEAAARDAAGRLGVIVGVPDWNPRAEGALETIGVRGKGDTLWREVERTQPAVVAAMRNEAYSSQLIDLAKRERWPVPSITIGTVAIQNYYSISTQAGITVPLPVFDWGQGLMARAKANNRRARLEKEVVVATSHAELKRALRLLEHHRHALVSFDSEIVAKLPGLARMAEDSFRAGEAQLIDLIDATRTRFEIELTRIDMLEHVVQAEIDVLAITGRIESKDGG